MTDTNEAPARDWRAEAAAANVKRHALMLRLGLGITSEFVPFSQSRHKAEKDPSLNYRVTLWRGTNGASHPKHTDILTTDYMMGLGHCHAHKASVRELGHADSVMRDAAIRAECETGQDLRGVFSGPAIKPDPLDVMHSLLSDTDVINCGTFEEWTGNFGYDTDSRNAEATYRACLEIALKLRNGIGEAGLAELAEAFRNY